MTIDPINQPQKINANKPKAINNQINRASTSDDKVSISESARKKTELNRYINIVKNTPDLREEKIIESRKNLEKLFTPNGEIKEDVVEALVSKIIKALK